ncbi:hypothetical protein D9756_002809 [Leucocoprinus leucothites]|uniref:Uncharacterized protein n=1 Tax=Leucocoprinus leucothites TaxID=201217 RepID=A0A8H5GC67_9AGAR|nr:hypothetical protein D9756_002809 [Leucoagaricus leucothites]
MQPSREDIRYGVNTITTTSVPAEGQLDSHTTDLTRLDDFDEASIEVLDPYNPSISFQIQNLRRPTVNSVDELEPSTLPYTFAFTRSTRSSFERRQQSTHDRTVAGGRPSGESTRSLGLGLGRMEGSSSPPREQSPLPLRQEAPLFTKPVYRRGTVDPETTAPFGAFPSVHSTGPRALHTLTKLEGAEYRQGSISSRSVLSEYVRHSPFSNPRPLYTGDTPRRMTTTAPKEHSTESFMQPPALAAMERGQQSLSSSMYTTPIIGAQDKNLPLRLYIATFLTVIVPQQIYLHLLLRLPYMYHSRVIQVLLDANLTLNQMNELTLWHSAHSSPEPKRLPRAYSRLKKNWETFIDNVLREWKTLNIIAGLLLSGVVTIFQIDGASSDPITRYLAFWSLISAVLSLMYGCFFIIRFSNMRRVYKATEWAVEAQKKQTMFWNVWVMLSMPAIWLVWSMIAYIACIMSFLWRVRPDDPNAIILPRVGPTIDAAFRIFISCVLGVGVLYAILIINTLRHYGSKMDRMWSKRIRAYRRKQEALARSIEEPTTPTRSPPVHVGSIIPPTPPQPFEEPRLSSSPPAPRSPPFAPRSSSPLSNVIELRTPLDSRGITSPYSLTRRSRSPHRMSTILSGSRQRLSPDPTRDSPPDSPTSVESWGTLPMRNDALGLFVLEEQNEVPAQQPDAAGTVPDCRWEEQADLAEGSRPQTPTSPSEVTGSTLVQGQRTCQIADHDDCYCARGSATP